MYRITALQNRSQKEISNRMDGRFTIPQSDFDVFNVGAKGLNDA